jgi:hypothetical protein
MKLGIQTVALVALVSISNVLSAHGEVLRGDSREAFDRQINAFVDGLDEAEGEAFSEGIIDLAITRHPMYSENASPFDLLELFPTMIGAMHITLDGVDTEEILRHGRELIKDNDSGSSVGVSSTEAQQQTDNRLDCLREHVVISRAEVVNADWGRQLELDIRNNLSWPMAGLWFSYSVRSPERSVPWDDGDFPISIAGGIEPGETRTIRTSIILPREAEMPLEVIASILDAADQDKRLFINERGVMGWPDEQSVMGCE